jgi:molybdopterin/thiamine biosynthesis adenylyltransferase/rhodanese-related sulfurtransferase
MLSTEDRNRYSRQIILPNFGLEAQDRLKNASVLVIGCGALGCPVLTYLASAGVGKIGLVDGDHVEFSNLHRQPLYTELDIGKQKARVAKIQLKKLNASLQYEVFDTFISRDNAFEIAKKYDVIVDGTDNFPTRYLINDLCVLSGKVNIHASILQYTGQVSVFNFLNTTGERGPNYRDLYPTPPLPGEVPSCAEGGVIGALPGIIGTMQAMEVIKVLTGIGTPLSGRLFCYDTLNNVTHILNYNKDPKNPLTGENKTITGLIDYDEFCGINKQEVMNTINVSELKQLMDANEDIQLIDVREIYEYEAANINGIHIPMGEIPQRFEEVSKDKKVIIHCRSGARSANVIAFLEQNHGYTNLSNLTGGIIAWAQEIDNSLDVA